jgi:hypothetical protein
MLSGAEAGQYLLRCAVNNLGWACCEALEKVPHGGEVMSRVGWAKANSVVPCTPTEVASW